VVEKNGGEYPYIATDKFLSLYKDKNFGNFVHQDFKDVPVNILYNCDTTGGNSGSPILNARGELIGLNFDRVFEATINDYGWDERYSRSIGIDIRYILWFLEKYGDERHLLKEMKIQ
jgi:Peptidase S46